MPLSSAFIVSDISTPSMVVPPSSSSSSGAPVWAIALITVIGVLMLVSVIVNIWLWTKLSKQPGADKGSGVGVNPVCEASMDVDCGPGLELSAELCDNFEDKPDVAEVLASEGA